MNTRPSRDQKYESDTIISGIVFFVHRHDVAYFFSSSTAKFVGFHLKRRLRQSTLSKDATNLVACVARRRAFADNRSRSLKSEIQCTVIVQSLDLHLASTSRHFTLQGMRARVLRMSTINTNELGIVKKLLGSPASRRRLREFRNSVAKKFDLFILFALSGITDRFARRREI